MTSTNCGLCQGNMSWCYEVRGPRYHWVIDLYERLNLPVVPCVVEALQRAVKERRAALEKQKTEFSKKNRINMKVARVEDQAARRNWGKRQAVQHTYGGVDDEESGDDRSTVEVEVPNGGVTIVSGRKCKCGSTEHRRTSHSACPLNKKKILTE